MLPIQTPKIPLEGLDYFRAKVTTRPPDSEYGKVV